VQALVRGLPLQAFVRGLARWLLAHGDLIAPLFFLLFFAGTFLAAFHYRRRFLRSSYVVVFFACLLAVNLTPGQYYAYPIEDLHKFSGVVGEEKVNHLMYVEDSAGRELRFDRRIVPTVSPASSVAEALATRCSPEEAAAAGRYLLRRAQEYRDRIESPTPRVGEWIDFPRHQRDFRWTEARLEPYGRFVALEVYELRLVYTESGLDLESAERTPVFEVRLRPGTEDTTTGGYDFEDRCV
jgi:hypothetical protein